MPTTPSPSLPLPTASPDTSRVLVRGATVLTVDPELGVLPRGDVLVEGERILAVGTDLSAAGATVIDATGMIALPGFVDAHVHAWEGQLRGSGPVVDFGGYLGLTAFGAGPRYSPDDVYAGTLATAVSALDAGITTVVDNAHNALTLEHAVAGVQALTDAGLRGVAAVGAPFGSPDDGVVALAARLRESTSTPLVGVRAFGVHPSDRLWRAAAEAGLWVSTELGPHTPDLTAVMGALAASGLLGERHAFNHCYDLPEAVWRLVAESGAAVNLCPRSDAAFGLGSAVAPVEAALACRGEVGLSGDNEISYALSMFAEMQVLQSRYRAEAWRRRAAGEQAETDALTPERLLRMATLGGAANAGLADRVGSLTPGKQADIVLLRADSPRLAGVPDPMVAVTAYADTADVDTVLVAGRLRKRYGRLVGRTLQTAQELAVESRERLAASTRTPA
ncbi:cytosine/adenosine deaminase-related metal-dependent hydrolase [Motilibacter rhizosphaerae]|uniref:Cytosine/adenosine deaminase-related metal-dependent hydrolase n=1 Tax=Motilibacter rhizosphaerae TaxID=598652 RepID=A0A4Q7NB41_9ACTN|nr:amidohydrolase family protein [Motilibacter rhizosphaerae]RZS80182.1 cytosine/adenosine deaminase-related metal-dependent hydrolase [Motilibacter rhizosphaerae]